MGKHVAPKLSGQAGDSWVSLNWSTPDGVDSFRLTRAVGNQSFVRIATFSEGRNSYNDTDVVNGKTYKYQIGAVFGGSVEWSNTLTAIPTAPVITPLPAPVLEGTAGDAENDLEWSGVSSAINYRVQRAIGLGAFTVIGTVNDPTVTYTDSDVINGTLYRYRVRAADSNGILGSQSNEISLTPKAAPVVPAAPVLTGDAAQSVCTLDWNDVTNAVAYRLERSVDGQYAIISSSLTTSDYTDSTVINGKTYLYRVSGISALGIVGTASNELTLNPAVVLTASTLSGSTASGANTLTWTAVSGADGYRVRRDVGGAGYGTLVELPSNVLTYTDSDVANGTTYNYRLVPLASGVAGPASNIITLTPASAPVTSEVMGHAAVASGGGVTGGAGGVTIHVNNWAELYSACVNTSGARIVKLHGTTDYNGNGADMKITRGDLTVDGSDFTGKIKNYHLINVTVSNVIFKNLRLRTGEGANTTASNDRRCLTFNAGNEGGTISKFWVDHVSMSFGPDVVGSALNNVTDLTISNCLIGPGLADSNIDPHGVNRGWNCTVPKNSNPNTMWGKRQTYYRNLYIMNDQRNLKYEHAEDVDTVNNVVYDYGVQAPVHGNPRSVNIVNNMFKKGPDTKAGLDKGFEKDDTYNQYDNSTYFTGNLGLTKDESTFAVDWSDVTNAANRGNTPVNGAVTTSAHGSLTVDTASIATMRDIIDNAGCLPSDAFDTKIKNHAKAGTSDGYYNGPSTGKPPFPPA